MSEPTTPRRHYGGWIALVLMLSFLAVSANLTALQRKPDPDAPYAARETSLKMLIEGQRLAQTVGGRSSSQEVVRQNQSSLVAAVADLAPDVTKSTYAARLYLAFRTEQGKPIMPEAVETLAKSKVRTNQVLAKIYGSPKLTPQAANELVRLLPDTPFSLKLAKIHARERAGIKDARADISFTSYLKLMVVVLGAFLALVAGTLIWIGYLNGRRRDQFAPQGAPLENLTLAEADGLAIRAAQILASYFAIGLAVGQLRLGTAGSLVVAVLIVTVIVLLARVPAGGMKLSLAKVGISRENFWTNVGYGVIGFLAEIPLTFALGALGYTLFSRFAPPTHPASELIQQTHDLAKVLPIIFFGSLIAPFWEEFMFRGLLFPALRRVTGSLVAGVVISSLIFGAIHPQGPALLLALASVGGVSCMLSYQTKSLVPSIVLHMLHNTATFIVLLLMT